MNAPNRPGDRRGTDPVLRAVQQLQSSLEVRHTENRSDIASLREKVDLVLSGFPDGDPDGHRRFHETMIRKAEAREKFWNDMRAKLIERGIWAVIGVMLIAFSIAAKDWLRR